MFYDSTLQSYGTAVFKFMDAITTNIPAISSKSNIVSISPNPSTNYFTISFTEEVAGEVCEFDVGLELTRAVKTVAVRLASLLS